MDRVANLELYLLLYLTSISYLYYIGFDACGYRVVLSQEIPNDTVVVVMSKEVVGLLR